MEGTATWADHQASEAFLKEPGFELLVKVALGQWAQKILPHPSVEPRCPLPPSGSRSLSVALCDVLVNGDVVHLGTRSTVGHAGKGGASLGGCQPLGEGKPLCFAGVGILVGENRRTTN